MQILPPKKREPHMLALVLQKTEARESSKREPHMLIEIGKIPGLGDKLKRVAKRGGTVSIHIDIDPGCSRHRMLLEVAKAIANGSVEDD